MREAEATRAIEAYLNTFAFVKPGGLGDLSALTPLQIDQLMQELAWRALTRGRVDAIASATADSWFRVTLNGVPMELPRYTIMTMRHCITASADGKIDLLVETAHWERMRQEMAGGGVFLDIGAATGAMSVPYALKAGADSGLRIVAFEPSLRARTYLQATVDRNKAADVLVLPVALSDGEGSFDFIELPEDQTGTVPYLPEASRLKATNETLNYEGQVSYPVEVKTLDALHDRLELASARKLVVKIDVEGFEDKVLKGAIETLKRHRPVLSIDIHLHPAGTVTTDSACEAILAPLGYRLERIAHVMIGHPS